MRKWISSILVVLILLIGVVPSFAENLTVQIDLNKNSDSELLFNISLPGSASNADMYYLGFDFKIPEGLSVDTSKWTTATLPGRYVVVKDVQYNVSSQSQLPHISIASSQGEKTWSFSVPLSGKGSGQATVENYWLTYEDENGDEYEIALSESSQLTVMLGSSTNDPVYSAYLQNPSPQEISAGESFTSDVYVSASDGKLSACQLSFDCNGGKIQSIIPEKTEWEYKTSDEKYSFYGINEDASKGIKVATITVETDKTASGEVVLSIKDGGVAAVSGDPFDKQVTLADDSKAVKVNIIENDLFSYNVDPYASASGKYLVKYTGTVEDGKVLKYSSGSEVTDMYFSEEYNAWVFLADSNVCSSLKNADFSVVDGTKSDVTISYDGDVNLNGLTNIVDAQIAYDITNNIYQGFDKLPMKMWLKADMSHDEELLAADAQAIQTAIHTQ